MPEPKSWDEDTSSPTHGPAPTAPTNAGATYVQAQAQSVVDALNVVIAALKSAGILAQD